MSRNFLVTAVAAASLVAFSASGFAQEAIKSSKSDTSDRMGGGGGARAPVLCQDENREKQQVERQRTHGWGWRCAQWWRSPRHD